MKDVRVAFAGGGRRVQGGDRGVVFGPEIKHEGREDHESRRREHEFTDDGCPRASSYPIPTPEPEPGRPVENARVQARSAAA